MSAAFIQRRIHIAERITSSMDRGSWLAMTLLVHEEGESAHVPRERTTGGKRLAISTRKIPGILPATQKDLAVSACGVIATQPQIERFHILSQVIVNSEL